MKLIIFPGNFVPHVGGLETHVDEFSKYFSVYAEITIFTPKVKYSLDREVRYNKVKVIRYPAIQIGKDLFLPNLFSKTFWKLYKNLKKENYDWVMTRTRFFPNTLLGFIFSKFNKIKNIHVEHGSGPLITKNKLINFIGKIYDLTLSKLIIKKSYKTISISQAVHDFLLKKYKIKTPIISRGLDFDEYKVKEKKLEGKIKIGFVGRLTKWKGLMNSVKAFNELN
ncbi:MAG: glycosyltransferase, partial [Candidatus Woesearchaeota archaeon]